MVSHNRYSLSGYTDTIKAVMPAIDEVTTIVKIQEIQRIIQTGVPVAAVQANVS
jgi:hypothetical protein